MLLKQSWLETRSASPSSRYSTGRSFVNRASRDMEIDSRHSMHVDQQSLSAIFSSSIRGLSPNLPPSAPVSVYLPTSPIKLKVKSRYNPGLETAQKGSFASRSKTEVQEKAKNDTSSKTNKCGNVLKASVPGSTTSFHRSLKVTTPTQFQTGKTGIYSTLWKHANTTKTFKYSEMWDQTSPRHKFMRRKSSESPCHLLQRQKKKVVEAREKPPGYQPSMSKSFLRDFTHLQSLSTPPGTNSRKTYFHFLSKSDNNKRTCLSFMEYDVLMNIFKFLDIEDLKQLMCSKRLCLWTSCPCVWDVRSLKVIEDLSPLVRSIEKTDAVKKEFLEAVSQLEKVPENYFRELCDLQTAERVVRDVVTVLGIIVNATTEPFCKIKTMLKKALEVPLVSWPKCKQMLSQKTFFRHLKALRPVNVDSDTLARLRPFLKHKHMQPKFVSSRCQHASKLALWAHKLFIYCLHDRSLRKRGEKSLDTWKYGRVIAREIMRRRNLWNRCEDGWMEGIWQY
jgi:hypothetical protein